MKFWNISFFLFFLYSESYRRHTFRCCFSFFFSLLLLFCTIVVDFSTWKLFLIGFYFSLVHCFQSICSLAHQIFFSGGFWWQWNFTFLWQIFFRCVCACLPHTHTQITIIIRNVLQLNFFFKKKNTKKNKICMILENFMLYASIVTLRTFVVVVVVGQILNVQMTHQMSICFFVWKENHWKIKKKFIWI